MSNFSRNLSRYLKYSLLLLVFTAGSTSAAEDRLFQYSTINALLEGYFDGDMTYKKLQQKGDFGYGTFNRLDGEMLALDGFFYQIKADGKAYPASPETRAPFAVVSFFRSEQETAVPANLTYPELEQFLDKKIDGSQLIYAIRIEGEFKQLTLRSIPPQTPPYLRLAEVLAEDQVVFRHQNARGTLVGYRFPSFMSNLNVPGYHFHFIDDNRRFGGHVMELKTAIGLAKFDSIADFTMKLPRDKAFSELTLDKTDQAELKKIEKGS